LVDELKSPTAQASVLETAATALKIGDEPGLGLLTRVHFVPFQRNVSVLKSPLEAVVYPTAHALEADVRATPEERCSCGCQLPGWGCRRASTCCRSSAAPW
jgi:hypothetical protein